MNNYFRKVNIGSLRIFFLIIVFLAPLVLPVRAANEVPLSVTPVTAESLRPASSLDFLTNFVGKVIINIFGQGGSSGPKEIPTPTPITSGVTGTPSGPITYYYQCDGSFNYGAEGTCINNSGNQQYKLCFAGCGVTAAAMVLDSHAKANGATTRVTPNDVVKLYNQVSNFTCAGTSASIWYNILKGQGVTVQSPMSFPPTFITSVIPGTTTRLVDLFRSYTQNGWKIFVAANFCDSGCGHLFLIDSIDAQGNVQTYDPYYGYPYLMPPPFNVNQYRLGSGRTPPQYKYAFLVQI